MFKKVLIANRGEITCRVAATLHEMGIRSVAVYSEADRGALHTRVCDEARFIGPPEARESYLNAEVIVRAAKESGADAVHPGFGFLAENAAFAEAVEAAGLAFIGPTAAQIRAMGDKREARRLADAAGVPIVPGVEAADGRALVRAANAMGYPVIIKAALGGGGKGMQAAHDAKHLAEAIEAAQRVAASAFGDASVYVEKLLEHARHVEVQVLGDGKGRAVHVFERDCTLQRRHQKVVEEAPAPTLTADQRAIVTHAAVRLAEAVKYRGAGTIETLLTREGQVYFLEMNTRLQVEHPVTELVTGIDLVRAQLEIAATGRLPFEQHAIKRHGHAIEARLYAEDAARDFLPQVGTATRVRWPDGPFVRVDAGVESGDAVTVHYDPMLAKIIAYAPTREAAIERLLGALDDTRVHGVVTNLPFLRALLRAPEVRSGAYDTEWVEREFLAGFAALMRAPAPELALAAVAIAEAAGAPVARAATAAPNGAAGSRDPFAQLGRWRVRVDAAEFELVSETMPDGRLRLVGESGVTVAEVTPEGSRRFVRLGALDFVLEREGGAAGGSGRRRAASGAHDGGMEAPMPGVVTKVMVVVGDEVTKGQPLVALEAMKMEHLIRAPRGGRVQRVSASPGQMVQAGTALVELEAATG